MRLKDAERELSKYAYDKGECYFDILHVYPGRLTNRNNGIRNYRFFKLVGFNTANMTTCSLGTHDELRFWNWTGKSELSQIGVWADGSFLIAFRGMVHVGHVQSTMFALVED